MVITTNSGCSIQITILGDFFMGYFSGKALILAGTLFTTASVGVVTYDGSETLNAIKSKISFQTDQVVKYDSNQQALINKVQELQKDANAKIKKANNFIASQKVTITNLKGDVVKLNGKISELQITIDKKDKQISGLVKSLEEVGNNFKALELSYNQLLASNTATLEELEDTKLKLDEATTFIKDLKARIAELEAELDKANADLKETTEKLNHTQAQLEEQTAKYNEAVKQRDQLQTELDAAVAKAKKDAELIEDLNNTVTEFKDTVYDLQEEGDDEINKANGEITKAEGIIESANSELKKANDAQDAANAEVKEANADVEKFGNEVNEIMNKAKDLKAKDIQDVLNLKIDDVVTNGKFD